MFNTRRNLSTRADRIKLAGANEPVWKDVLFSEGETDAWRIVEVSSLEGRPFDIELLWSAANGAGANVFVTVPHATRICVFARTVQVRVKNLDREPNAVGVTIADGYAETRNQFEVRAQGVVEEELDGETWNAPVRIKVPPFAQRAWVEPAEAGAEGFMFTIDGDGRRRGVTRIEKQPDLGIPVGGASELQFWLGPMPFRVVFSLGI